MRATGGARRFLIRFTVSANRSHVEGTKAALQNKLRIFFSVSLYHINLEAASTGERAGDGSGGTRRQGVMQTDMNVAVQLEDDHETFLARLTDMRSALSSFLEPSVESVSAIYATCGQGHYPIAATCAKCAISTYKEALDDEGFEEGCLPCPSDHMLTPAGATSLSLCTCDEENGYTWHRDGATGNSSANVSTSLSEGLNSSTSVVPGRCSRSWQLVTPAEAAAVANTVSNVIAVVAATNIAIAVVSSIGGAVGGAVGGAMGGSLLAAEAGVAGAEAGVVGGGTSGGSATGVSASGTVILISQVQFLRYTRTQSRPNIVRVIS